MSEKNMAVLKDKSNFRIRAAVLICWLLYVPVFAGAPIISGADPDVLLVDDTVWVYPTSGYSRYFYAYSSTDLVDWQTHGPVLNLDNVDWVPDNKHAWAPGIIEKDGTFYLYYSVGPSPSHIGVAYSDSPAGPFTDSGEPLLSDGGNSGFEAIDAMVFRDPQSGKYYFYAGGSAGSRLRVYELNDDMISFKKQIPVDNPTNFTEGAFMHYYNGNYYLSYSNGYWGDASYSVHYSMSSTPYGPWSYEGVILESEEPYLGPGHHSFLYNSQMDEWYIFYHRHYENQSRHIALEKLEYYPDGRIKPVVMTDEEIGPVPLAAHQPPRCISHWRLDETSGTTASDASDEDMNGVLKNGLSFSSDTVQGRRGRALNFDGVNQYVELPEGYTSFRQGFTVTFWAYPTAVKSWARFIELGNGPQNNNLLLAREGTTNNLTFKSFDGDLEGAHVIAEDAIKLNRWQFFAATVDSDGNVKVYKNGDIAAAGKSSIPFGGQRTRNYIGRSNWDHDDYYAGYMDDIRIFNYKLDENEVAGIYDSERRLLHNWKLDDQPAWQWNDDSSWTYIEDSANADTESYIKTGAREEHRDAVTFGESPATPRTDASVKFGGALEHAGLGDTAPGINEFTLTLWFKMNQFRTRAGSVNTVISADTGQPGGWSVHLWGDNEFLDDNDGKPRLDFFHKGYGSVTLIDAVVENQWYNVMLARDSANNFNIYVDDQIVHSGINTVRFENGSDGKGLWLAKNPTNEFPFDGYIDDVRIYNYAADDIYDLTGNERIGYLDLAIIARHWLMTDCGACAGADIDLTGKVDFTDFTMFAENWLTER